MQTLVFGIDSCWEYVEPGFPLLYPLLREKKLVLLSARDDAPDPASSVALLENYRSRGTSTWQAIILISDNEPRDGRRTSLASHLHQLYRQQLALFTRQIGAPKRVWVVSLSRDSSSFAGASIQILDQVGYVLESMPVNPWLFTLAEINSLESLWNSFTGQLFNPENLTSRSEILDSVREKILGTIDPLIEQKIAALPTGEADSFFSEARYKSVAEQFKNLLSDYLDSDTIVSLEHFSPADLLKQVLQEGFSLSSEQFKNWLFLNVGDKDLSHHYTVPYLISSLSQWDSSRGQGEDKFWKLKEMNVDSTLISRITIVYRHRLEQVLERVQEQIASPLAARVSLLEKPYPESSTSFSVHKDIDPPTVKSSSAWGIWKEKMRELLADYQEQGKELVSTIGEELRQGKGRQDKKQIDDIHIEITAAEATREEMWQKFRERHHLELNHNWDAAISPTSYRLLELFLCRPTQVQRWVTALAGLLLFLLPVFVLLGAKGWAPELYQQADFIVSCVAVVAVCLVIVLFLYLRYRFVLRRLCRKSAEVANGILRKIHTDTENNVDYLVDLFNFSVAEQNLQRLEQKRKDLLQQRSRWTWFETEIHRHLNWANMLRPDPVETVVPEESSEYFNFDLEQESQQPCSLSPVFSLVDIATKTEIRMEIGTQENIVEIEYLPGLKKLHLVKETF